MQRISKREEEFIKVSEQIHCFDVVCKGITGKTVVGLIAEIYFTQPELLRVEERFGKLNFIFKIKNEEKRLMFIPNIHGSKITTEDYIENFSVIEIKSKLLKLYVFSSTGKQNRKRLLPLKKREHTNIEVSIDGRRYGTTATF